MTLTATQIAARRGKLTSSRIACLMTGDAEGILRLYREMIGEEQPEDLSRVWPVRLGESTEQLQLDWFQEKNRMWVRRRGEVVVHPQYEWAACTLDGWLEDHCYPIEVKHCGGREPLDPVLINRYQPQCQWIMFVTDATQCALSVILGANEPIVEFIARDDAYIAEMVRRGEQFMACVANLQPPVVLPAVPAPVDATKIYDMSGDAVWEAAADRWLQSHGAAETAKESEKILKSLVPEDAKKASGKGVRITRDRVGRLSLREDK